MAASLFKPHVISVLFYCFWCFQTTPINADTPLHWLDLSSRMLLDRSMSNVFYERPPDLSVKESFANINHFSDVLLIPNENKINDNFNLHFQGVVTDSRSSEIDGVFEYSYDLVNFETIINIETSKPILISYDDQKAQIINLTGNGYVQTNNNFIEKNKLYHGQKKVFDELSDLHIFNVNHLVPTRVWQTYMFSAMGHGGNDGNDKKETSDNKKLEETNKNVIICPECGARYYGIKDPGGNIFFQVEGMKRDNNTGAWVQSGATHSNQLTASACEFFRTVTSLTHRGLPETGVRMLDSYPPCPFYAELDAQNSNQPAVNYIFPLVYNAMRQWSNRPENSHRQTQAESQSAEQEEETQEGAGSPE